MLVGHIKEIVRHPVKSFRGESVQKTNVMQYGVYGDRSHAFLDETRSGKFLTITQHQKMVQYQARFVGEESMFAYPTVEITSPEGKVMAWGDEDLLRTMEMESKRKISFIEYSPTHVPLGAIEAEPIQLVTDASLNELQTIWGKDHLDHRRFRPNFVISLTDKIPFIEQTWFGKRMRIGRDVEIELRRPCERCMIITVSPDDAERDPTLQKTVQKNCDNHFGVYASVTRTGEIGVGDEVFLLD
ncbi:MOSC domain-containing protein [Peribacillus sp. NPDC097198]|uniref:MOSC domain-containing protein n=1 Tax=Peribacillus sp. NPDC097198 TaxID=3364397 RepID=UPI00382BD8DF